MRTVEVLPVVQSPDRKASSAPLRGAKRPVAMAVPPFVGVSRLAVGASMSAVFIEAAVPNIKHVPAAGQRLSGASAGL